MTVLVVLASVVVARPSKFGAGESTASVVQTAAVLVALVPQGLAIMVTVTYATAALRISRAGALVQRVNAVESMSRVDTLVLDKTGTITAPHLEPREVLAVGGAVDDVVPVVETVVRGMPPGDRVGDALRGWVSGFGGRAVDAVVGPSASASGGLAPEDPSAPVPDVVPFSSARRWSGVVDPASGQAVVLGAPEAILSLPADPAVTQAVERWTGTGLRVVVLARARARARASSLRDASGQPALPPALSPAAVFGFAEEIRADASETLRAFESAGVAIKVVSGDNPDHRGPHRAGCRTRGRRGVLRSNGPDLAGLDDEALGRAVERATVVGRVEPNLKARIVHALRSQGRYVAMVGDGVNDILALRSAQLGVAMETGSSASRAVADIVLLQDQFAVLPRAVAEGRRVIDGMLRSSSLLVTRTLYMLLIVLGAAIGGLEFPFTPRNGALLAFVTVGLPSLVVVAWARPIPSPPDFVRTTLRFAVPAAIAVAAVGLPVYAYALSQTGSVDVARSALITITTYCGVLLIPVLVTSSWTDAPQDGTLRRRDWRPAILAVAMIVLFGAIMSLPLARWFYAIEPIPVGDAVMLGLVSLVWALVVCVLRRLAIVDRLVDAARPRAPIVQGDR